MMKVLVIFGVVTAVLAWLFPDPITNSNNNNKTSFNTNDSKGLYQNKASFSANDSKDIHQTATLNVSAIYADITIYESKNKIPFKSRTMSGIVSDQIIYLPKGQLLLINLTGTSSNIKISKSIAEQITINNNNTISSDIEHF